VDFWKFCHRGSGTGFCHDDWRRLFWEIAKLERFRTWQRLQSRLAGTSMVAAWAVPTAPAPNTNPSPVPSATFFPCSQVHDVQGPGTLRSSGIGMFFDRVAELIAVHSALNGHVSNSARSHSSATGSRDRDPAQSPPHTR